MGYTLVLLRHGESIWNAKNKFTGWTDVDLSLKGLREAKQAGKILKQKGFTFDIAYTSYLRRSIRTTWIVLDEMDLMWIPIELAWELNERHYGALQGLNKKDMARKFGEKQVHIWRRSYDLRPPALTSDDPRYPSHEQKYVSLKPTQLPLTECLKDTVKRVIPYWKKRIIPDIKRGKKVLISAHGNSLRALVKHLDNVPENEIVGLNIPTGIPLVYELDNKLKPIRHYYLADEKTLKNAIRTVEEQGHAK